MLPDQLLDSQRIQCHGLSPSRKRVLQKISQLLARPEQELDDEIIYQLLLDRENMSSTGFGNGFAIPHARVEGIDQPRAAFLRLERAVDFNSIDEHPVDLIFGIVVPAEATETHLKLLAQVAACTKNGNMLTKLRGCSTPDDVLNVFNNCQL